MFAKNVIDLLTAEAWLSEDKQLIEKVRLLFKFVLSSWLSSSFSSKFSSSQVTKLSIQTGVPSEYTRMIQLENTEEASKPITTGGKKKVYIYIYISRSYEQKDTCLNLLYIHQIFQQTETNGEKQKVISRTIPLQNFGIGFGDTTATKENVTPGFGEARAPDAAEKFVKAASSCCVSLCNKCCCM